MSCSVTSSEGVSRVKISGLAVWAETCLNGDISLMVLVSALTARKCLLSSSVPIQRASERSGSCRKATWRKLQHNESLQSVQRELIGCSHSQIVLEDTDDNESTSAAHAALLLSAIPNQVKVISLYLLLLQEKNVSCLLLGVTGNQCSRG